MKKSRHLTVIVGTRAELIKIAPVLRELLDQKVSYRLIFTNQHVETIDELLREFELPVPDIEFFSGSTTETKSISIFYLWFIKAVAKLVATGHRLIPEKGGAVLVHGDTVSTVLGAILGRYRGCTVVHLEAGLRSGNLLRPFPEEINRRIVSGLAQVYLCPNAWAVENVKKMNGTKVNTHGNTIYDAVHHALHEAGSIRPLEEPYVLTNLHRYEQLRDKNRAIQIVDMVIKISSRYRVVFVMHPVTNTYLSKYRQLCRLSENENITVIPKMSFTTFIGYLNFAEFVITDGGSNQEELSYLGKPTAILRKETERLEGLNENARLVYSSDELLDFVDSYGNYVRPAFTNETSPSQIVVEELKRLLDGACYA